MDIGIQLAIPLLNSAPVYGVSLLTSTVLVIDSHTAGKKFAIKYFPSTTTPLIGVGLNIAVAGSITNNNFKMSLESDNSDAPSGTVLNSGVAITDEFTPTSGLNYLDFASSGNSGNLTLNVPVWIVIERTSGAGTLDASNKISLAGSGASTYPLVRRAKDYNGSVWNGTAQNSRIGYVVKRNDGSYDGEAISAFTSTLPTTTIPDIFGSNKQGAKFRFGSKLTLGGVIIALSKTGAPSDLVVKVYEGATERISQTVSAGVIISGQPAIIYFSTPHTFDAGADIYIILSQDGGGGSDSADYDFRFCVFSSTYRDAIIPSTWGAVYGTGTDFTAVTPTDTEFPCLAPLVFDPSADLSSSGGTPTLLCRGHSS